jgi:Zn-dependent protease
MLAMLPLWYVAFLFSLTCHEAAHALVAKWGGDLTAYHAGQVTLNPLPHIQREPWGTVLVPLISYLIGGGGMIGWGSAPYDPYWEERYPKRAAWMALAGPAANVLLMVLSAVAMRVGMAVGVFQGMPMIGFAGIVEGVGVAGGVATFLSILFSLNLLLALFNLIPVPPLDGRTAIGLILPAAAFDKFREFTRNPMFQMFGVLLAWYLISPLFQRVFGRAVLLLVYSMSGVD